MTIIRVLVAGRLILQSCRILILQTTQDIGKKLYHNFISRRIDIDELLGHVSDSFFKKVSMKHTKLQNFTQSFY